MAPAPPSMSGPWPGRGAPDNGCGGPCDDVGGPQFGYGSLPGAVDGGCCGNDDDAGGGAKLSRVDDGGGALPGPDADNALDGRPSEQHTNSSQSSLAL